MREHVINYNTTICRPNLFVAIIIGGARPFEDDWLDDNNNVTMR